MTSSYGANRAHHPPRRLPHTDDIVVPLYKYTDNASTICEDCKDSGLALYQVQGQHDVRGFICFQVQDKFNAFLTQNPDTPDTSVELQKAALIRLVVADGHDPDSLGTFQRWRPAFFTQPAISLRCTTLCICSTRFGCSS